MSESPGDTAFFDRIARFYGWFGPGPDAPELRAGLELAERDVERVFDVGGGAGRGASAVEGTERVVVDAAEGMTREARRKGYEAVRADAATLPFADGSTDAVLVVDALHHFGDPAGAIAEAARVLRPGGVLVIRDFDPTGLAGRFAQAGERLFGFDSTFFSREEILGMLTDAGLEGFVRGSGSGYTAVGRVPSE